MMKKYLLYSLCIFSFFIFISYVDAGVCDGKNKDSYSYCQLDRAYNYYDTDSSPSYSNRYFNVEFKGETHKVNGTVTKNTGLLGYAYDVYASSTLSGLNEPTFCIDNGLLDPQASGGAYNLARELNINAQYDKNVYRVYQKYVNDVGYEINKGTYNDAKKYELLSFADVMIRMYTIRAGYNVSLSDISNSYGKKRAEFYYNELYPYITSNKSKITLKTDSEDPDNIQRESTWGKKSKIDEARTYFSNVESFQLWENPLKISAEEVCDDIECAFNFKVDFKSSDEKYVYFGDLHDLSIGLGNAYFQFLGMKINDKNINEVFSNYDVSPSTKICVYGTDCEIKTNDSQTFTLHVPRDKYDLAKANLGELNVSMIYKTYHPMSAENVFVNKSNVSNAQRMIVFTKYDKEKKFSLKAETESNLCDQEGDIFYYNNSVVGLDTYKLRCGCEAIDYSALTTENNLNLYNRYCPFQEIEKAESNLRYCDGNTTDYDISYEKKTIINRYCNLTCTEDIHVQNLVKESFQVKAGMQFGFDTYPKLISTKKCTVNIDKEAWEQQYETELKKLADTYNEWAEYSHNYNYQWYDCEYKCGETEEGPIYCPSTYVKYTTSYNATNYSNFILKSDSSNPKTGTFPYGCNEGNPHPGYMDTKEAEYNNQVAVVRELLNDLIKCNNYIIKDIGELNTEFYNLQRDLNFYYSQTYSKKRVGEEGGIVWNNRKPEVNIDDSDFKVIDEDETDEYYEDIYRDLNEKNDYTPYISNTYTYDVETDGVGKTEDINDSGNLVNRYVREVKVITQYEPSKVKYRNVFTGDITANRYSVELQKKLVDDRGRNVYDTNITALEKGEQNYYQFYSLGSKNDAGDGGVVSDQIIRQGESETLKRYCDYEITNEILDTSLNNSKLNLIYRVVDPSKLDPNNRLVSGNGFKNWKTESAKAVFNKIQSDDANHKTYSSENLEYSFSLDSADLKDIRAYNKGVSLGYDDFNLECVDGTADKCESSFIEKYVTSVNGRNTWKNYVKTGSICRIDDKVVTCP